MRKLIKKSVNNTEMPVISTSKNTGKTMNVRNVEIVQEVKKPAKRVDTQAKFLETLLQRDAIKGQMNLLEERLEDLNKDLKEFVTKQGVLDDKGSTYLNINDGEKDRLLGLQARKSISLNKERAEELFKSLKIWEEVTESVRIIKDEFVAKAVENKKLTIADLESIKDEKVTFAFVVDPNVKKKA